MSLLKRFSIVTILAIFSPVASASIASGADNCNKPSLSPTITVVSPKSNMIVRGKEILEVVANGVDSRLKFVDIFVNSKHALRISGADLQQHGHHPNKVSFKRILSIAESSQDHVKINVGLNKITITAWDNKGRCREEYLDLKGGSKDIAAIVIGIKDYKFIRSLKYADNDAKDFRNYLINTIGVPPKNIEMLKNKRAEKREIEKAFIKVNRYLSNESTLIVYYSGHGFYAPDDPETYPDEAYLLPFDAEMGYHTTLLAKEDILTNITKSKAGRKFFFLDSCFSGAQLDAKSVSDTSLTKYITPNLWKNVTGMYGIYSSGGGQASYEDDQLNHGVFTHFLLESFEKATDYDDDQKISLHEAYRYLKPKVQEHVLKTRNKSQEPMVFQEGTGVGDLPWGFVYPEQ